jgi:two-component system NtrC family sensor kinase
LPDLLKESREGLARVKRIVNDLRDFSGIDDGQLMPTDLTTVLEQALKVVANDLGGTVELVRELTAFPPVEAIAFQIEQVFINLLINAAQAMCAPGRITLRNGFDDDDAWVEITDTGCGMSEDVQRHIFDPFYTTKPVGTGTGLGLSMSWEIVQRHQGGIQVKSSLGLGSTFRVILPLSMKADHV